MAPDASPAGSGFHATAKGATVEGSKKRKEPPKDKSSAAGKDGGNGGGRFHKRAKVFDARTLRTQPADAALSNGELDLQAFLAAREFEIRALTDGMRRSKAVNNRRAFQLVPRGMRRRTASHNVKKLPKRLRPRARREQVDDNTPVVEARRRKPKTSRGRIRLEAAKRFAVLAEKKRKRRLREARDNVGEDGEGEKGGVGKEVDEKVSAAMEQLIDTRPLRPKIRRNLLNNPLKPKAKFRKRQIDKTWLPTHLWHAKRATMTPPKEPLWRFAIPLTPAEKVYRPTHRASTVKGAMIWDMSYMSTIGLYGRSTGIQRTLQALGLSHDSLWDDRGKRWRDGQRKWSGVLSKENRDARRQIGPATVLWNPEAIVSGSSEDAATPAGNSQRQVYIRVHPSCFLETFDLLVKLTKRETPRLYVEDLRFEIGSIELTGPGATEALLGTIRPRPMKDHIRDIDVAMFESLATTTTATAIPSDAVLGLSVHDPRLHYPPRTVQSIPTTTSMVSEATVLPNVTHDTSTTPFLLFDRDARFEASRFPSQKALNRRKAANPPGQPLEVTRDDPPFPVILFAFRAKSTAQTTWTILAPWKCILPVWYSLVHYPLSTGGNPRVGGLDELRQVAFEHGLPWFPGDFPGTDAGAEWELEQREKRKAKWERRPKSKRVAWKSLDLGAGRKGEIGHGWACEFERLFGLQIGSLSGSNPEQPSSKISGGETVPTEGGPGPISQTMEVDGDKEGNASSQQLCAQAGGDDEQSVKKAIKEAAHPLKLVRYLSKASFNAIATAKTKTSPPPHSLITVKIVLPGRGVVSPCARVYRLPAARDLSATITQLEVPATYTPSQRRTVPVDLREQWLSRLPGSASHQQQSSTTDPAQPSRFPADATHEKKKLLLAQSLMTKKLPFPPDKRGSDHPPVPNEEDLIGYITRGEFNLMEGRGVAIGSVSAEKALEGLRTGKAKEGQVCIVRNAGESVGWVGRWEIV